jgi:SAM-dependent methyltransferase
MNPWERFFNAHAQRYMDEPFTRGTSGEVDFLVPVLGLPPGAAILDVGCGTGRHAIELARRGFLVTGLDISEGMLGQARDAAAAAGVRVELIHADATSWVAPRLFDAAVCLCEGAFSLLGADADPDDHDRSILRGICAALRPGAPFVLTALNAFRLIRAIADDDLGSGRFDPLTLVESYEIETPGPDGPLRVPVRERTYLPRDLLRIVEESGFRVEHLWGGTAGEWARRPLRLDEYEIMVVARRPEAS